MKRMELKVKLKFSENIADEDVQQIVDNVLKSLVHTANTAGITPEESNAFTTKIEVIEPHTALHKKHSFIQEDLEDGFGQNG